MKYGCCVDKSCTPETCMGLSGKTCGDCVHAERCVAMYGKRREDISCDFFPRKFREKTEQTEKS